MKNTYESGLAEQVMRCWGKTGDGVHDFHPAVFHMLDVGHVSQELLSESASFRWRGVLSWILGIAPEALMEILPWLIALHDIGKISAVFQSANEEQKQRLQAEGLTFGRANADLHHTAVGQVFVGSELTQLENPVLPDAWQAIWREVIAGHHGRFAPPGSLKKARARLKAYEPPEWADRRGVAAALVQEQFLRDIPVMPDEPPEISAAIMVLTGFTILCDWLGSDSTYFAPHPESGLEDYVGISRRAARKTVEMAGFTENCRSSAPVNFKSLFSDIAVPRPLQTAVDAIPERLLSSPCLAIIESPTGEGKTEAALALAHRIARASGTDEMYYALPTTATSNQMFGRVQRHVMDRLGLGAGIKLIHGQAFLVEDDLRLAPLQDADRGPNVSLEWFAPRKRALLAPFGVGTIDQAELAALNVAHAALRLIGLAGKVLILDEVHAYDTYMTTIIERLLNWLSAMGTSVILLSATLPLAQRLALAEAYGVEVDQGLKADDAYPSVWVVNREESYHVSPQTEHFERLIEVKKLHVGDDAPNDKAEWLVTSVQDGGCACWMCNTVDRAQRIYRKVRELAPPEVDCMLLHARFPLEERQGIENDLTSKYGRHGVRPNRGIVIGTQVLEQSLDIDFDVMVSDLAPIDLLLQRAGRLHRHTRTRPEAHNAPRLWINTEIDTGGELQLGVNRWIYAEFILRQTWLALAQRDHINLPDDYRTLIEAVYGSDEPGPDSPLRDAWQKFQAQKSRDAQEARLRLLPEPDPEDPFCGPAAGLVFEEDENRAGWIVAQTRLGEESLNVIPLEREGDLVRLPSTGQAIPLGSVAPRAVQLALLRRSLRVSHCDVVQAIKADSASLPALFTESTLLKRHFPVWLTNGQTRLQGKRGSIVLELDPMLGLVIRREGG